MELRDTPRAGDPDTIRDTIEIRPLRKWASRLFVTGALISALWLAIYASMMIRSMSSDPQVQARMEAIQQMRDGLPTADSLKEGSETGSRSSSGEPASDDAQSRDALPGDPSSSPGSGPDSSATSGSPDAS